MTVNFGQAQQWKLLETWYMDKNPHKSFDAFLRIRGFPNSPFETNGLYYLQIFRKFWFASRATEQLEWVRDRMMENKHYEDYDGDPSQIFIHDAEYVYNEQKWHKIYKEQEKQIDNINSMFQAFSAISVSGLLLSIYILFTYYR